VVSAWHGSPLVTKRLLVQGCCAAILMLAGANPADAQRRPAAGPRGNDIGVRGFGMFGNITFTAKQTFETVLDKSGGPIFGGGAQVLLPWGLYVEVGAWRFAQSGERVFIAPDGTVFKLGIPVDLTITPLELTGGLRFATITRRRNVVPFAGVGYSRYRYQETSDFADANEDVDENFPGFHVSGGVEYLARRWLAISGEVSWSSVPDAIGQGGVSAHFDEDNLGGTSIRLKVSVGR
jgi:hypothetical protein